MGRKFIKGLLKVLQLILAIIIAIPFIIPFVAFINESGIKGTKPLLLVIPVFLIFLYVSLLLHEGGHVIAGWLVKIGISRVVIGTGREIARTNILGFPWVITNNPKGGYTFVSGIEGKFVRLRLLFFTAGGLFFQVFWILLCIGLLQLGLRVFVIYRGVDLLAVFVLSNLPALYFSLVPGKPGTKRVRFPATYFVSLDFSSDRIKPLSRFKR